jgi:hypothetical protein
MQFQVPQFIETEDKIIGPLTLKQFIYVAVAFGILFGLFFLLTPLIWLTIAVPVGGFAAALALVKIQGRPFANVVLSAIHFYWRPQQYAWQPEHPIQKAVTAREEDKSPSLEKIVAGFALKTAWRTVQTGSKAPDAKLPPQQKPATERYEVFRKTTGENRAAKRVDYR